MELAFPDLIVTMRGSNGRNRFWLGMLYVLYASLALIPAGGWAPVFLIAGLIVILGVLRNTERGPGKSGRKGNPRNRTLSEAAAYLAFLLILQQGILHAKTEMVRGNRLGAAISLGVVTPILAGLGSGVVKGLLNRLFEKP